jgi:hypothetical protein
LVRVVAVVCAAVLVLAGCGSDPEPEPPLGGGGATSSPEPSEEPTDQATEESDPDAIPSEYPGERVSFVGLPDLRGKWRQGLKTYVDYERGLIASTSSGELNDLLTENTSPQELDGIERGLKYGRDHNQEYGGPVRIEILKVHRSGNTMGIELCLDLTDAWWRHDGELQPPDEFPGKSTALVRRGENGWKVMSRAPVTDESEERVPC